MKSDSFVKQIIILVSFLLPFSFVCAQENENLFEAFEDSLMDETLLPQVVVTDSVKSAKMIIMKVIENNKKNIGSIKSYQASEVRRYSQNINEVPKKWKRIAKIALLFSRYRKLVNLFFDHPTLSAQVSQDLTYDGKKEKGLNAKLDSCNVPLTQKEIKTLLPDEDETKVLELFNFDSKNVKKQVEEMQWSLISTIQQGDVPIYVCRGTKKQKGYTMKMDVWITSDSWSLIKIESNTLKVDFEKIADKIYLPKKMSFKASTLMLQEEVRKTAETIEDDDLLRKIENMPDIWINMDVVYVWKRVLHN